MNINQIRKEIEQIRQHLCADDESCNCQYVEINEGEPIVQNVQVVIEANKRCCSREDVHHVGYSSVTIAPLASAEELAV